MSQSLTSGEDIHQSDNDNQEEKVDYEVDGASSHQSHDITQLGPEPTEEEIATLEKVADTLPVSAWLVALVELCERFCYYGITGPFQNYMEQSRNNGHMTGGLGLGQSTSTALNYFFQFFCYVTPIGGAIVADQYWGKYKTIAFFAIIYVIGNLILFCTSLPTSIDHGAGMGGLIAAMVIIGTGTGGLKPNISPLIAEQYTNTKQYVKTKKNGTKVIVDPTITIQSVFMIFYFCINFGSLSSIATTELEKNVDFWAAYLLPFAFFFVGIAALFMGRKYYVNRPPQGSIIVDAFRVTGYYIANKFSYEKCKPAYRQDHGMSDVQWSDLFVDEVQRSWKAISVFCFLPIYWVVYGQMTSNFVSQAATMQLHGVPNDLLSCFDSIAIILFVPLIDRYLYPGLRRIGIPLRPMKRIFLGFVFAAIAMAYAAIVQWLIDTKGEGHVHVVIQIPAYILIALSEMFASVTGMEYAYTKAPANMKSFIMAMFLLTNAFGDAIGMALSPVSKQPYLRDMYTYLAVATFVAGCIFLSIFWKYDREEEAWNMIDQEYVAELNANLLEQKKKEKELHQDDSV